MAPSENPIEDVFLPGGKLREEVFTKPAYLALHESLRFARDTCWESLRSPHIFMGLLFVADGGVKNWGDRLGADLPRLLDQFLELFLQEEGEKEPYLNLNREFLSDNVIRLLRDAYYRAKYHCREQISTMDLLISLFTANNSIVAECFERSIGVTAAKLTELAVIAEQNSQQKF